MVVNAALGRLDVETLDVDLMNEALAESARRHDRLCPRQVLGVRIGLAGAAALGFAPRRLGRSLIAFAETDGCFVDGVEAATGCSLGHRTLRVEDLGRIATTFLNTDTGEAVRVAPRTDIRDRAFNYADGETRRYQAQLIGYQHMPTAELLTVRRVHITRDPMAWVGRRGTIPTCATCGEEIINAREVFVAGEIRCAACAGVPGARYYRDDCRDTSG